MKIAIIGSYGHVGQVLNATAAKPDAELVAVARWGEDDPLNFLGHHPACGSDVPVYDHYRQMLDDARPDVVGVFVPLYRTAEVARSAVQRGCHVACEKPLATELADLAAFRADVQNAGVHATAMFTMRQKPAFQALRHAIAAGRIGRPVLATAQKSYIFGRRDDYYRRRETFGGSIPWVAIHALDFVTWCTGLHYARGAALAGNAAHDEYPGCEDHGAILMGFAEGGEATITFDYLRPAGGEQLQRRHGDDRLRVAGTEGVIEVVEEGTRAKLMTAGRFEDLTGPTERSVFVSLLTTIEGGEPCLVPTEDAFAMTEIALKLRDAAGSGNFIDL